MVHISPVVGLAFVMPSVALHVSLKSTGEKRSGIPICTYSPNIFNCPQGEMGCMKIPQSATEGKCQFKSTANSVTGCAYDNPARPCTKHSDCYGYEYFDPDGTSCAALPTPPPTPMPPTPPTPAPTPTPLKAIGEEVPVCTKPLDLFSDCLIGQMACSNTGICMIRASATSSTGCTYESPHRPCTAHSDCTGYVYFNSENTRCQVSSCDPRYIGTGTCTISEDPHIRVFDGLEVSLSEVSLSEVNKAQSEDDAGDKWLVKSGQVSVQARYTANDESPDRNLFVRAIAVGGTFLNGSLLIVGSLEDEITWDGQPILQENASYFEVQTGEAFIKAKRGEDSKLVQDLSIKHPGVSIELPLGVNLIVNRLPKHINVAIMMPPQEDQEGLCGNFNGVGTDDSLELSSTRFDANVNPEASLFDGLNIN